MIKRYIARYKCHKNLFLCCQYTDLPTCNSPKETHFYGMYVWYKYCDMDD